MNHDAIIKATNRVAIYATAALVYWTFVFLTITVFDLKIFRERMTEIFLLSLLGIFAILGGAITLNVMSNLSKISAAVSARQAGDEAPRARSGWRWAVVAVSFPVIAACLFAGHALSAERKKELLVRSAQSLISENQPALASLAAYEFSPDFVKAASRTLGVLNKIDKNFPEVMMIVPDTIDGKALFLGFGGNRYYHDDKAPIEKSEFIYATSREERDYLSRVFAGTESSYRFHAEDGNYQLYFPATVGGRKVLLYFSDYQRYGKIGS